MSGPLGGLLLVLAAIAVGSLVAFRPTWALGAALLTPLVIICSRWSGTVAVLLLLWGGMKYGAFALLPSLGGALAQTEVVLVLLVLLFTVLKLSRREVQLSRAVGPYTVFGVFVGLSLLSWAVNEGTLLALFAGIRSLATLPILALAAVVLGTERDMKLLMRGGVALTFAQVPLAYLQVLTGGASKDVDLVNGTLGLGGANLLGIWMLAAFGGCFYLFVRRGGLRWLVAAAAFSSVIAIAGARLSIIGVPIVLVGLGIMAALRPHVRSAAERLTAGLVVLGFVAVVAVSVMYAGYARSGQRIGTAVQDLNPSSLLARQSQIGDYSVPRVAYVTYGWDFLQRQSRVPLLGTGPATAGSGSASASSPDYQSAPFAVGLRLKSQGLATYYSSASVVTVTSQLVSSLVEYGPVGLLLLLVFYATVGLRGMRSLWRREDPWLIEEALTGTLPVFLTFATIGTVYGVTWEGLNIIALGLWWCVILSGALGGVGVRGEQVG